MRETTAPVDHGDYGDKRRGDAGFNPPTPYSDRAGVATGSHKFSAVGFGHTLLAHCAERRRMKTPHTLMRRLTRGVRVARNEATLARLYLNVTPPGRVPAMFFDNWG